MTEWHWLVQQAILGVDRSNFQIAAATKELSHENAALRTLLEQAAASQPSSQFLHTAAIFNQLRCAGLRPRSITPQTSLSPCPPESRPAVSDKAASWLRQLLIDENIRLLCEWLSYANAAQYYLPHDTLPELLELTMRQRELAEYVAPCLGERGRWLLALNPLWQLEVATQIAEREWQEGNIQARAAFLHTLRRENSDKARDLLIATWKQEPAKDRVLLLAGLEINLSLADEPFLESCLSDRSEHVRTVAARLLAGLTGSTVQKALLADLGKILRIERQWLRRTLQVALPETFAPDWNRLALKEAVRSGEKIGQKAWWLQQLLSLIRPTDLARQLQVTADDLLTYLGNHDFAEVLLHGLLQGAETHEEYDFLLIYLKRANKSSFLTQFVRYAAMLPDGLRTQALQIFLSAHPGKAIADWGELTSILQAFERLSPALSEQLLTAYFAPFLRSDRTSYAARHALGEASYRLAPAAYPRADEIFSKLGDERGNWIHEFLQVYQTRSQIEQAFNSKTR